MQAIGAAQGNLRGAHLKYHLLTLATMDAVTVTRYAELRGYLQGSQPSQHQHQNK